MARWIWLVGLLLSLGGCDRLQKGDQAAPGSEGEKEGARCRQECAATYRACLKDCQNDSPQACESRCDLRQKKCTDGCDKD